jgi:hypothetical protein
VSETMNLHQVPEARPMHRALWAGRIMSALVVIALVTDGTIQLFAPAQIASMLQETGFAVDLTRVLGPIILACAILYAIPATAILGAILVTGFLGWMDLGLEGTERVAGTTSPRDVFASAQKAATA